MDLDDLRPMTARDTPAKARRKPRGLKTQSERREEAMTAILDAAEPLFARMGPSGVTVRALGQAASVDASLVHYYFVDMDGVYRAVFQRKSVLINAIRNKAMDEYLAAHGDAPTVEGAFDVFLRPAFETIWNDPKQWTDYVAIVAHANSSPFQGRDEMRQAFDYTVSRFIELLKRLAPEVPPEEIYWQYHMLSGSLLITLAQTGRIDVLSGGLCHSSDMKAAFESMKQVFCGGFEAIRGRHAPAQRASAKPKQRRK